MLVSRNVFHVVSALQSTVFILFREEETSALTVFHACIKSSILVELEFGGTSFVAYNELKAGIIDKRANDLQPEDIKRYDTGGKSICGLHVTQVSLIITQVKK